MLFVFLIPYLRVMDLATFMSIDINFILDSKSFIDNKLFYLVISYSILTNQSLIAVYVIVNNHFLRIDIAKNTLVFDDFNNSKKNSLNDASNFTTQNLPSNSNCHSICTQEY